MEVNIAAEIYYIDKEFVFLIKNDYQSKLYLEENNTIISIIIINHYYVCLDFIKIIVNIYLSPIIKSNKIIFNRNMIECIINTLKCIYEKFSFNNKIYNTDPLVVLTGSYNAMRNKCLKFVDDRMNNQDRIDINNCCVFTSLGFTYLCHLYDENAIKWI